MATIRALASLSFLVVYAVADSVTKCGLTGLTSYYNSTTLPYLFYNNPWGNDGSGYSCITVDNNGTSFDATWKWANNSADVHAYPHITLESSIFPLPISQLSTLEFAADFGVNITSAYNKTAAQRLQAFITDDVQYDVTLDMFLDANETAATSDLPTYEVMIWLSYSYDVYPVGIDTSSPDKYQYIIDGTRFFLFNGNNTQNQTVYSWLPETNLTSVDADYSPLIHYLWQNDFMPKDVYLGTLQFGTEQFHATEEVLFRAGNYSFNLAQNKSQVFTDLSSVSPIAVPTQVPTTSRFESNSTKKSGASPALARATDAGVLGSVWCGIGVAVLMISWL
ncbi:concanavalin A-like lectin/glucanase domain-containing protein [Exophiala viscosa]|uniref:concanavalin A-like lectin/glucanase domain-containing protein n=1 Tax=Exophiala viscosa TaxID=2486360 RepID=UPI002194C87F|nr:concanavalin A-like lectin/glucanase domain-containing protein [Exophiala viscosa]